jgi:hypothetical protein
MSFVERLTDEGMQAFNVVNKKPFGEQAVAFLNAYWTEVSSQAEFIFSVGWEMIKAAEMHSKGIQLLHQYHEGSDVDFDIGLYFYEKLCKFLEEPENAHWAGANFRMSQPVMMTALKRKQELREKVDVNFDGRISFLEYLLYQYGEVANPADFVTRLLKCDDEHPEILKARQALADVSAKIREYEAEKARLEGLAAGTGVKALGAKNQLAQLSSGPLAEELNRALITAEAAVRIASKKFSGSKGEEVPKSAAVWWLNRDLDEKKKRYGKKDKK